ncbi:MAG: effector-associated domain EAD1-containing protein [Anaerolineales bacterium]|nr:MAG: effector-associated domain EAD1-containing protein [Anaerolineales bacterium]
MKKLSGSEYQELQNALLSAFPSELALEQLVKFGLDKDLNEITSGGSLSDKVFKLIEWVQAYGQLRRLIFKAHQRNSQNPDLNEFYAKYRRLDQPMSFSRLREKQIAQKEEKAITSQIEWQEKDEKNDIGKAIIESEWLDNFGFVRSPFEKLEAGSEEFIEPGFLSNCFVDPDGFLGILGQANAPITQILYASRGEGKTACRVMTDYLCQHGSVPDKKTGQREYVLSIPHIHLHIIADTPTLDNHVIEIMNRAIPQFAELLLGAEKITNNLRLSDLTILNDINWYINHYGRYLNLQQIDLFLHAGFKFPFDVTHYPYLRERKDISPLEHLRQWCKLMNTIGVKAVYALIDGLDELASTAADLKNAYYLLSPLITNRDLLDKMPFFALKCFLPIELENLILADQKGRPELIPTQKISWSSNKLKQLLRLRIQYFRHPEYQQTESGFEEFCAPELYGSIEDELIRIADYNPRSLLKLCDLMVKNHCRNNENFQSNPYKLIPIDLDAASDEFKKWKNKSSTVEITKRITSFDLRKIIAGGETDKVEFKSSLIRDLSNNQPNDALIMKVGKEIAGMLNSNGGVLLIGVADDKTILGIEGDFEFLGQRNKNRTTSRKDDIDGFGLKLVDLIKDYLGASVMDNIQISFETFEEKIICVISVGPSSHPIFFGKQEEFYIRGGTANIRLSTREIISYTKSHWQ